MDGTREFRNNYAMKEIDRLLKQWIPVNTIIREEIREAIVKECFKSFDLGTKHGYEMAHDEVRAD